MSQGTGHLMFLELDGYGISLRGPDPDRQIAFRRLLFKDHDPLIIKHTYSYTLNRHLDHALPPAALYSNLY